MGRAAGFAIVIALGIGGCDRFKSKTNDTTATASPASTRLAIQRRLQRTCASNATYDRLKVAMFEEAARVRGGRVDALDQLEAATLVRMESPVVKSRDEALNVTVCTGRFVLELPEGAVRAFNGERRLKADIEYSAQQAIDNSGLVYQMQGAEPIVYKLAALDLGRRTVRAGGQPETPVAITVPETRVATAPATPPLPPREPPVVAPPSAPRPELRESVPVAPRPRVVEQRREVVQRERAPSAPLPPRSVERDAAADSPRQREFEPQLRAARAQPSFNCNRARLRVETMVCGSDRLAAADRAMSATYFRALAVADPDSRALLRRSRDRFLAFRNRCSSEGCVEQAYSDRIDEIRDLSGAR